MNEGKKGERKKTNERQKEKEKRKKGRKKTIRKNTEERRQGRTRPLTIGKGTKSGKLYFSIIYIFSCSYSDLENTEIKSQTEWKPGFLLKPPS